MKQSRRKYIKTLGLTTPIILTGLSGCLEEDNGPQIETRPHTNSDAITDLSINIPEDSNEPIEKTAYISLSYKYAQQTEWEIHITYGSEVLAQKQIIQGTEGTSVPVTIEPSKINEGNFRLSVTPKNSDYPTSQYFFKVNYP
jgi:hypothetical protein